MRLNTSMLWRLQRNATNSFRRNQLRLRAKRLHVQSRSIFWMRPVVFIGPTLSRRRCSALLGAEYLPPARKGSLNEITPGRVVAIIDGEIPPDAFLPECEVREALDRDVVLFGAASVGAYYASNFANLGMHGVGWVYDQYRAGALSSFDEIAVMYDPVSLRALSVPLVNVRFWLEGLIAASLYDQGTSTPFWKGYAGCRYPTAMERGSRDV